MMGSHYDRANIALILIGRPKNRKKIQSVTRLYNRVGLVHEYRLLAEEELVFVLECWWHKLGQELNTENFPDTQVVAAIARITRGNFRLVGGLFFCGFLNRSRTSGHSGCGRRGYAYRDPGSHGVERAMDSCRHPPPQPESPGTRC